MLARAAIQVFFDFHRGYFRNFAYCTARLAHSRWPKPSRAEPPNFRVWDPKLRYVSKSCCPDQSASLTSPTRTSLRKELTQTALHSGPRRLFKGCTVGYFNPGFCQRREVTEGWAPPLLFKVRGLDFGVRIAAGAQYKFPDSK